MTLRAGLRRGLNRLGWDLHRHPPPPPKRIEKDKAGQIVRVLAHAGIGLVLDVGANRGQFALGLRAKGYRDRIVSFEPLREAHDALTLTADDDPLWRAHPRCAIGDAEGEIAINVAGNSQSSSALPMRDLHVRAAAGSAYAGVETAPLHRLDAVVAGLAAGDAPLALKIDVQGFEGRVLDGAPETLRRTRVAICELSLAELYEGQAPWREMIDRFEAAGLTLWTLQPAFTEQRTGRTLQLDAAFLREEG